MDSMRQEDEGVTKLIEAYKHYKENFVKNIKFDPNSPGLSKLIFKTILLLKFSPDATMPSSPLQVIQIYFDTATFDEIERDVKVTLSAQLGLIGGTMGLLTGFSILSGIEIIYFIGRFFMALRVTRADINIKAKLSGTVH